MPQTGLRCPASLTRVKLGVMERQNGRREQIVRRSANDLTDRYPGPFLEDGGHEP